MELPKLSRGNRWQTRPDKTSYWHWVRVFQLQENIFGNIVSYFIYADIRSNGRMNHSGVWNCSDIRKKIEDNDLGIPSPIPLPFGRIRVPYVFVGDDAFALKNYMMKPYPQRNLTEERRIYNYRHSRSRRILENLFGILTNKWRIFQHPLRLSPRKSTTITTCALVLHN